MFYRSRTLTNCEWDYLWIACPVTDICLLWMIILNANLNENRWYVISTWWIADIIDVHNYQSYILYYIMHYINSNNGELCSNVWWTCTLTLHTTSHKYTKLKMWTSEEYSKHSHKKLVLRKKFVLWRSTRSKFKKSQLLFKAVQTSCITLIYWLFIYLFIFKFAFYLFIYWLIDFYLYLLTYEWSKNRAKRRLLI